MPVRNRKKPPPRPIDIRDVQTIKHDRVFMLCDRYGDVPKGNETIKLQNFGAEARKVRIELTYGADFLDLFEVRGFRRKERGKMLEPVMDDGQVTFAYEGLDGVRREFEVGFDPHPKRMSTRQA